jgi:hypothetical protein
MSPPPLQTHTNRRNKLEHKRLNKLVFVSDATPWSLKNFNGRMSWSITAMNQFTNRMT